MSKKVKTLIISAGALLVLAAALIIVIWIVPEKDAQNYSDDLTSNILDLLGGDEEQITPLLNRSVDEVMKLTVSNNDGGYTFDRMERDGEYYWVTDALGEVAPDDAAIRRFIGYFSALYGSLPVEENVSGEGLEKYGLKAPAATVELEFEDNTSARFLFGIRNPAKTDNLYCTMGDGVIVQVSYLTVGNIFCGDARPFAQLVLTEDPDADVTGQPEYIRIWREDLGSDPVEIRYMSELDEAAKDESIEITTLNTYRFTEPIWAELDASKASWLYKGLCGLSMNGCEFLEKSEENLRECGLDEPFCRIEFKLNGEERVLLLGREFTKTTETSSADCYYAVLEDTPGIFSLQKNMARWATFTIFGSISNRLVSPYIYACESVEITTPNGNYRFDVNGDAKTFSMGGEAVNGTEFRKLYQKLIEAVGDELYTEPVQGEPVVIVRFNYRSGYSGLYGGLSDEVSYYRLDARRYAAALNGNTLLKVNAVYIDGLIESVDELVK